MQWYREQDIRCELFGVFQGGGAKGVAFAGALKALAQEHWWFHSVGGASAGAITAALVASGIHPHELGVATIEVLTRLDANKGWWCLAHEGEYFRKTELRKWLTAMINRLTGLADPSFEQLREETGIHLDIVATNISTRSLIVFSADDTPTCSVADAVTSSCAIPFAFEDGVLVLPHGDEEWSHAIVDGGVWANFPLFLYTDKYFRHYYERHPQNVDQSKVVGFVLDKHEPVADEISPAEPLASKLQRNRKVRFGARWSVFGHNNDKIRMWEQRAYKDIQPQADETAEIRWKRAIEGVISWPLKQLGSWGLSFGFGAPGWLEDARCPNPTSVVKRSLVEFINGYLSAFGSSIYGGPAVILIVAATIYTMALIWIWIAQMFGASVGTKSFIWGFAILFLLAITILGLMALVITVASAVLLFFVQCPVRRILYGLLMTYVEASGAPEWYRRHPSVVYLPVGGVGLLDFDLTNEMRMEVERRAIDTALNWIRKRLPS